MQAKKPVTGSTTNATAKSKATTATSTSSAKTTATHTDASHPAVKQVVGKAVEKKHVETEKKPAEAAAKKPSIVGAQESHDKKAVAPKADAKKSSIVGSHGTKEGAAPKGDVKKPSATADKKAAGTEGAQGKAAKGHAEEKSKAEHPEVKAAPLPVHEIKLPAVEGVCKDIVARNKTPLILDKTGNYFTFLKYKGNLCDFQEFEIKKGMGKTSKEDFLEVIRTRLVGAMKVGNTCALFIDKGLNNLGDFFKGVGYFKVPESLVPETIKNEKYFKQNILKPEEDVDGFGNKGGFRLHEDFILSVVANGDDENKLKENLGLPLEYFELVKISD